MRLGIDFGTTRTVVAVADRGNYPVVSFQLETGDVLQWYPSLIAARRGQCVFGLEAQARQPEPGWCYLRSLKRLLADLGPDSLISVGEVDIPALDLLTRYLARLRYDLYLHSNLELAPDEPLEALIAVPANANSNQRFLTLEGFWRAGFRVLGMINEPSAAGVKYAHRYAPKSQPGHKELLVIYDLGGGTFDASVISLKDRHHEVITDEGIARLGGDDFDEILLGLAVARATGLGELSQVARYHLLEICRELKERLHPNTQKFVIDLGQVVSGASEVMVTANEFYERCAPLVEQTIQALEAAIGRSLDQSALAWTDVAAIYLVGGSSDLPLVSRMLRERYGRRVRRALYPHGATAIGLAIAADAEAGYVLQERFTRYFGVWREADAGRRIMFDPLFVKDTPLPGAGDPPLVYTRAYQPVHNVGHFRYLECSHLSDDAQPNGDITPWDEIRFPLDPALQEHAQLDQVHVRRTSGVESQVIQERYVSDGHGMIEVTIANQTSGYQRTYRLRGATEGRRTRQPAVSQRSCSWR
jgi:molecular chaperone DnaK (HSP70)